MPRGNDIEGNATWNEHSLDQYGIFGNAEDMIMAHRASVDYAVVRAMLVAADVEQTELAKEDLDVTAEKLDLLPGETLIDCTVRGHALVGVVENPTGRLRKVVGPWTDKYVPPKLSPQEQAAQEMAKARTQENLAVAALQAQHKADMDELRAEMEQRLADAVEDVKAAVAEAHPPTGDEEPVDDIDEMSGKQLDERAAEANIADWNPKARVAEKRALLKEALGISDD